MIRAARLDDRPTVGRLQELLDAPSPPLLRAAFDAGVGTLLVIERDGDDRPVGYALGVPGDREASPSIVTIAELVVSPTARREGLGRSLVEATVTRADGYDRLVVTARADDERALAFYRACGFRVAGRRPDRFDGDGGLLLARDLA